MDIWGKKAVVFGLQRSGLGAVRLLGELGASPVLVTDSRPEPELGDFVQRLPKGVQAHLGGHPEGLMDGAAVAVVSPGVPLDIEPLKSAADMDIEVISEIELAYRAVRDRGLTDLPFYAVTGTNGKSTVLSLVDLMLRGSGKSPLTCGNIGYAVTEALVENEFKGFDSVLIEVSSFQLESITEFAPRVAAILNITADHLDRYPSMQAYAAAKARVFMNQGRQDVLVLNADDLQCMRLHETLLEAASGGPEALFFSRTREVRGVYLKGAEVRFDLPGARDGLLINKDEIRIKGVHNLENSMAAALMALTAGAGPGAVAGALREFAGLPHRLETVRELGGVTYVNDSKGTNVGAVVKSLESFDRPVVLIAGGRDKGADFSGLVRPVSERVRAVVLIGEAAPVMAGALMGAAEIHVSGDMKDAVRAAAGIAKEGDVVLLSPACASFDMFDDFEHRGERFNEEVSAL